MANHDTARELARLRAELDAVDAGLIDWASRRQQLVSEIGKLKHGAGRD